MNPLRLLLQDQVIHLIGDCESLLPARGVLLELPSYEQPLVSPQVSHLRQVPFRTMVNCLHWEQGSPS